MTILTQEPELEPATELVEPLAPAIPTVTPCSQADFQKALDKATPCIQQSEYSPEKRFSPSNLQNDFLNVDGETALKNLAKLIGGMKGVLDEFEKGKDLLPSPIKTTLEKNIAKIRESLTPIARERFFQDPKNKTEIDSLTLENNGKDNLARRCHVFAKYHLKDLYEKLNLPQLGALYLLQGNIWKEHHLLEVVTDITLPCHLIDIEATLKKENTPNTPLSAQEIYALVNHRVNALKHFKSLPSVSEGTTVQNLKDEIETALKPAEQLLDLKEQFKDFPLAGGDQYGTKHRERIWQHARHLLKEANEKLKAAEQKINVLRPHHAVNTLIYRLNTETSYFGTLWRWYVPEKERTLTPFLKIIQQDREVLKGLLSDNPKDVYVAFDRMVGCMVTAKDWPGAVQKAFNRQLLWKTSFALNKETLKMMNIAREKYAQLSPEQKEFLEVEVQLRTPSEDKGDISITEFEQRVAKYVFEIANTLLKTDTNQQSLNNLDTPATSVLTEAIHDTIQRVVEASANPNTTQTIPIVPPHINKPEIKSPVITPKRAQEILAYLSGVRMENKRVPPKKGSAKDPYFNPVVVLRPQEAKALGVTLEWLQTCSINTNHKISLEIQNAAQAILKRLQKLYDDYKENYTTPETQKVFFERNVIICTPNEFKALGLVDKLTGIMQNK